MTSKHDVGDLVLAKLGRDTKYEIYEIIPAPVWYYPQDGIFFVKGPYGDVYRAAEYVLHSFYTG